MNECQKLVLEMMALVRLLLSGYDSMVWLEADYLAKVKAEIDK
jgi:hypothetical protein